MRLLRGEHRILVREINTAHPSGGEFGAYGLGFFTVADEDRDVGRTQTSEVIFLNETSTAGLPAIEQCGDFTGAGGGHLLAIDRAGQRLIAGQLPDIQCRHVLPGNPQRFLAPLRLDREERHRVLAISFAKQKRAASLLSGLGAFEYVIDRCHHAVAGAEVGA